MTFLPSFARMTMWFVPWADPLLQGLVETPATDKAIEPASIGTNPGAGPEAAAERRPGGGALGRARADRLLSMP